MKYEDGFDDDDHNDRDHEDDDEVEDDDDDDHDDDEVEDDDDDSEILPHRCQSGVPLSSVLHKDDLAGSGSHTEGRKLGCIPYSQLHAWKPGEVLAQGFHYGRFDPSQ